MDILEALAAVPARGESRCRIARWLDEIPTETPGRLQLVNLVETKHRPGDGEETMSAERVSVVLANLGFSTTEGPIHSHRNGSCRCYR